MLYACDKRWWDTYRDDVLSFAGERWTVDVDAARTYGLDWIEGVNEAGLSMRADRIHNGGNSGYQAIGLAHLFGAARIVLLGYDMQRTGGRSHWHGDHRGGLPNLANLAVWRARLAELAGDLRHAGVDVVNATRETALEAFPRVQLEDALA